MLFVLAVHAAVRVHDHLVHLPRLYRRRFGLLELVMTGALDALDKLRARRSPEREPVSPSFG